MTAKPVSIKALSIKAYRHVFQISALATFILQSNDWMDHWFGSMDILIRLFCPISLGLGLGMLIT